MSQPNNKEKEQDFKRHENPFLHYFIYMIAVILTIATGSLWVLIDWLKQKKKITGFEWAILLGMQAINIAFVWVVIAKWNYIVYYWHFITHLFKK
jgi:hypothetical protein